jgi:hypothetical protein
MYKKSALLLLFAVCSRVSLLAQSITYSDLSNTYIYKITVVKGSDEYRSQLRLYVFKRDGKLLQEIDEDAGSLYNSDAFKSSKNSRSYITGKGRNAPVEDFDFGDLVIADLNFDGKEDIALKTGLSADSGPYYAFYTQGNDGHFYPDNFLTNHVASFPKYINAKARTITTQIQTNYSPTGKKTFKYNVKTKKWHLEKWVE